jgi:hypothetical protein
MRPAWGQTALLFASWRLTLAIQVRSGIDAAEDSKLRYVVRRFVDRRAPLPLWRYLPTAHTVGAQLGALLGIPDDHRDIGGTGQVV